MNLAKSRIKTIWMVAIVFVAFFVLSFFGNFTGFAQGQVDDFDAFQSSLIDMIEEFDEETSQVSAFSLQSEEDETEGNKINRLIVNYDGKVDSFGAVREAQYKDLHIFQYENAQEADEAFQLLTNSNITVSYDEVTTLEQVQAEAADPWESKTFRSWGAEHVGYMQYVQNMLRKTTPREVIVAVLDSGINTSHELFTDRILLSRGRDFTGETVSSSYKFEDANGHGTHVSGTIVESTYDNVKIIPLKVLKGDGKGTVSMIVSALEYVKTLKGEGVNVQALNMSIGIESRNGEIVKNSSLENAVVGVYEAGVVPVVSAGNDRLNTSYACPANVEEAFVVSALAQDVYGNLYFDSSYSNYGSFVDFSAPGTSIVSAGIASKRSYVRMSGTSMAAPHVTACVALIYSDPKFAGYSVDDVHKLLKDNALDLGDDGWDEYYGWGCVNVADVGVTYSGYVNFSVTQEFHTESFLLSLSYSDPSVNARIYYTKAEDAKTVSSSTGTPYTAPIRISETTRVTAVAYFDANESEASQSYISSQMYYFNNVDLLSNYQFDENDGGTIVKYNGKLSTLNVPYSNHGVLVDTIGANAFNGSDVQKLILPSSITQIAQNAFENNNTIKEISCNGRLQIGAYAFYKCENLAVFDCPKVSSAGIYAFAYCTNLRSMEMYNSTTIGRHAFSGSGIEEVFFGRNLQSVGEQRNCAMTTIYGYASQDDESMSAAEAFAFAQGVNFYDLTLRFSKNLNNRLIVRSGSSVQLEMKFVGRNCKYVINKSSAVRVSSENAQKLDEFETSLTVSLAQLPVGTYQFYVVISDDSGSPSVTSQQLEIDVVTNTVQTFEVTFNQQNTFDVFVDGQLIENSQLFYKDSEHILKIVPKDGFVLRRVAINGEVKEFEPLLCEVSIDKNSANLLLDVESVTKTRLEVVFETKDKGVIYVDNQSIESQSVSVLRENNLSFAVAAKEGYFVKLVLANGKILSPNAEGFYTIENILTDVVVNVVFEEQFNNVQVVCGKGGNVSTTGDVANSDLAFGSSRIFTISTNEGYAIDYVSVNGKKIEVVGNSFQVKNDSRSSDEVISVVISFKKANTSIFSKDSIVFVYFIIFLALFVIFAVATIILQIVRKKKKKDGKMHKFFY